jgi:hypothetical protein
LVPLVVAATGRIGVISISAPSQFEVGGAGFFESSPDFISGGGSQGFTIHTTDTVMWTFANVRAGDYVVDATARVAGSPGAVYSGDGANLQSCALTVIVTPVVG